MTELMTEEVHWVWTAHSSINSSVIHFLLLLNCAELAVLTCTKLVLVTSGLYKYGSYRTYLHVESKAN